MEYFTHDFNPLSSYWRYFEIAFHSYCKVSLNNYVVHLEDRELENRRSALQLRIKRLQYSLHLQTKTKQKKKLKKLFFNLYLKENEIKTKQKSIRKQAWSQKFARGKVIGSKVNFFFFDWHGWSSGNAFVSGVESEVEIPDRSNGTQSCQQLPWLRHFFERSM